MSDKHEERPSTEQDEVVSGPNQVEASADELSDDSLEDVAGGAMCQVGATTPTFPTVVVDC